MSPPLSWWLWPSSSSFSWSLSSSSKGFSLWKMQHFFELFFCMNSLSTVPSFHVTCFFFRLRRSVRVFGCCVCDDDDEDDDPSGLSSVMVVVTVADDGRTAALEAALTGLAMADSIRFFSSLFFPFFPSCFPFIFLGVSPVRQVI